MYAVEFQAAVKNGVLHLPKNYKDLYESQEVQVFIMPIKEKQAKSSFNPKQFFGLAKTSKEEIDEYLKSSKSEWDNYLDERATCKF